MPSESWVDLSSAAPHSGTAGPGFPSRPLRVTLSHLPHRLPSCPLQLQHSSRLSPLPELGNLTGYHHSLVTPLEPVPKFVAPFWVLPSMPNCNPSFTIASNCIQLQVFLNSYSTGTAKSKWESFLDHPLCSLSFPSHTHLLTLPSFNKGATLLLWDSNPHLLSPFCFQAPMDIWFIVTLELKWTIW